jgi:hypothetical protein
LDFAIEVILLICDLSYWYLTTVEPNLDEDQTFNCLQTSSYRFYTCKAIAPVASTVARAVQAGALRDDVAASSQTAKRPLFY